MKLLPSNFPAYIPRSLKWLFSKSSAYIPLFICLFISLLVAVFSQLGIATIKDPFERPNCSAHITTEYKNPNGTRWDSYVISIADNNTNPILTYEGCQTLCGSGTGWYTDIGPRLVQWFLPVILLVSNMQFPRLGMERYFLILHLLGDPIDSTWSLMYKVDGWARCYAEARARIVGTRYPLTDETNIKSLAVIDSAREEVENERVRTNWNINNRRLIRKRARSILRQRTNEVLRTILAVVIYIFQVVSAFVPKVGGSGDPSNNPSGGKIGPAMLLSWLVAVVLLSNAVGDLGFPADTREKVSRFTKGTEQQIANRRAGEVSELKVTLKLFGKQWGPWTSPEVSAIWAGGMYCYQPRKGLRNSGWKLGLISVLPVLVAYFTALAVLEAGPTEFSCRSFFVIGALGYWIFSALLTYALSLHWVQSRFASGKYLWYIILIKDFLVAVPILGLIVATSCGYWNTCYCWGGGPMHRNQADIQIQLNSTSIFNFNDGKFYPAVVGTGLGMQVVVFMIMLEFGWLGFTTMNLHLP